MARTHRRHVFGKTVKSKNYHGQIRAATRNNPEEPTHHNNGYKPKFVERVGKPCGFYRERKQLCNIYSTFTGGKSQAPFELIMCKRKKRQKKQSD